MACFSCIDFKLCQWMYQGTLSGVAALCYVVLCTRYKPRSLVHLFSSHSLKIRPNSLAFTSVHLLKKCESIIDQQCVGTNQKNDTHSWPCSNIWYIQCVSINTSFIVLPQPQKLTTQSSSSAWSIDSFIHQFNHSKHLTRNELFGLDIFFLLPFSKKASASNVLGCDSNLDRQWRSMRSW